MGRITPANRAAVWQRALDMRDETSVTGLQLPRVTASQFLEFVATVNDRRPEVCHCRCRPHQLTRASAHSRRRAHLAQDLRQDLRKSIEEVDRDVDRTMGRLFHDERRRKALRNVLVAWSVSHPATAYVVVAASARQTWQQRVRVRSSLPR